MATGINNNLTIEPFGKYAPDSSTSFLRFLTRLGISRGVVCRWVGKQWKNKGYSIVDAEIRGIKYRLNINKNTTDSKILTSSKVYDQAEIKALSTPLKMTSSRAKNNAAFVDIGANTGYYSLALAKSGYSKIIAIEPNPPTVELLRYNIAINDYNNTITVVPVCIGNGGKAPFYCSGGLGDASMLRDSHNCEPIMVDSVPLLDILQDNKITHIGGMKIDIEGFEDRALCPFFESAPESLWPEVIVIEVCNRNLWQRDAVAVMKESGYVLKQRTRANYILEKNDRTS